MASIKTKESESAPPTPHTSGNYTSLIQRLASCFTDWDIQGHGVIGDIAPTICELQQQQKQQQQHDIQIKKCAVIQIRKTQFIGINALIKYDTVDIRYVHVYKNDNIIHNISVNFPGKSVELSSTFEHKYRILFWFLQRNLNMNIRMPSVT